MNRPLLVSVAAAALFVLPRGGGAPAARPAAEPAIRPAGLERSPGPPSRLGFRAEVAARRATAWLLEQQRVDGSWRSPQYGVLRGGQAYTPFVLHALLALPPRLRGVPDKAVGNALSFIRSRTNADGALGYHDPDVLEYPVYATAYAILALDRASPKDPSIVKMARWLAGMQLAEARGFDAASPAYGGWGFGVPTLPPGDPGHMDVAHTRRALEALRVAGGLTDEAKGRALRFLGLVQKRPSEIVRFPGVPGFRDAGGEIPCDGGFFFSPIVLAANKALWERPSGGRGAYFRSYSTATADGVLALLAAGLDRADERIRSASAWLAKGTGVALSGIGSDQPEPWAAALRFYHFATYAEAASALGLDGWQEPLARRLVELQEADGRYANTESPLMKEDDPILATSLALVALGRIARIESSESRPN